MGEGVAFRLNSAAPSRSLSWRSGSLLRRSDTSTSTSVPDYLRVQPICVRAAWDKPSGPIRTSVGTSSWPWSLPHPPRTANVTIVRLRPRPDSQPPCNRTAYRCRFARYFRDLALHRLRCNNARLRYVYVHQRSNSDCPRPQSRNTLPHRSPRRDLQRRQIVARTPGRPLARRPLFCSQRPVRPRRPRRSFFTLHGLRFSGWLHRPPRTRSPLQWTPHRDRVCRSRAGRQRSNPRAVVPRDVVTQTRLNPSPDFVPRWPAPRRPFCFSGPRIPLAPAPA